MNQILSPGDVMRLGDLLNAIAAHKSIRFIAEDGSHRDGELRNLVCGKDDLTTLRSNQDVRDAHVWVTNSAVQMTVSVAHLIKMDEQGGVAYVRRERMGNR